VRIIVLLMLTAVFAGVAGCGGNKPSLNLTPPTEEQKRQYMEEERKIFEAEGGRPKLKAKR
jgi:hypothetical protein